MATKALAVRRAAPLVARRRPRILVSRPRRKAKTTIPLAVVLGFAPGAAHLWQYRASGAQQIANQASSIYLGIRPGDPKWYPGDMKLGTMPIVVGFGVHMLASKFGLNRMLARSGIPFVRI